MKIVRLFLLPPTIIFFAKFAIWKPNTGVNINLSVNQLVEAIKTAISKTD
jgi:hypothetical protein